ncbi:hypothetical protein [Myroides guanonis]|uniref:Uncharacterized protein n=1 Tax=Myroides guanonis TaxID=1150112 RepID=A0A1I3U1K7_9FLAO|nr:hypothetical protein [Myroides guanonis]SFJ76815.1 hypothetical protein SAMN04487893_11590 [Myroides guanonis]
MRRIYLKHIAIFLFTGSALALLSYYFDAYSVKQAIIFGASVAFLSGWFYFRQDIKAHKLKD